MLETGKIILRYRITYYLLLKYVTTKRRQQKLIQTSETTHGVKLQSHLKIYDDVSCARIAPFNFKAAAGDFWCCQWYYHTKTRRRCHQ